MVLRTLVKALATFVMLTHYAQAQEAHTTIYVGSATFLSTTTLVCTDASEADYVLRAHKESGFKEAVRFANEYGCIRANVKGVVNVIKVVTSAYVDFPGGYSNIRVDVVRVSVKQGEGDHFLFMSGYYFVNPTGPS